MLRVFFSLFLWNALFSYIVYMLSLLLPHGGVIRHLFVCFYFILKTCRRKEWRHYFILLANILLPRAAFGIYFTYFRTGIAGQERRILGIILCIPTEIKPS